MIHPHPTINHDPDFPRKIEASLGCSNDFSMSMILEDRQTFQRTEVIVYQEILDHISSDEQKNWGILSTSAELNEKNTAFDKNPTSYVIPLDTFATNGNYYPLFQKRIITGTMAKFTVSLTAVDPEGNAEKTDLKKVKKVFGSLHPISVKAVIW